MEPGSSRGPASAGIQSGPVQPGSVRVIVEEPGWRRWVPHAERIVARAARAAGGSTSVVLASDRTVRRLNARDRGRDKSTNVLTYPAASPHAQSEILLALGVIRREAGAARRPVGFHLAHLVVHGALHLAGHDHHRAGEARRMEMAEARILHRLRVPNPWRRA